MRVLAKQDQGYLNTYLIFAGSYAEMAAYAAQQGIDVARCTWAEDAAAVDAYAATHDIDHTQLVSLTSFWHLADELREPIFDAAADYWPHFVDYTLGSLAKHV